MSFDVIVLIFFYFNTYVCLLLTHYFTCFVISNYMYIHVLCLLHCILRNLGNVFLSYKFVYFIVKHTICICFRVMPIYWLAMRSCPFSFMYEKNHVNRFYQYLWMLYMYIVCIPYFSLHVNSCFDGLSISVHWENIHVSYHYFPLKFILYWKVPL